MPVIGLPAARRTRACVGTVEAIERRAHRRRPRAALRHARDRSTACRRARAPSSPAASGSPTPTCCRAAATRRARLFERLLGAAQRRRPAGRGVRSPRPAAARQLPAGLLAPGAGQHRHEPAAGRRNPPSSAPKRKPRKDRAIVTKLPGQVVLVLQGGGALGAYQIGVGTRHCTRRVSSPTRSSAGRSARQRLDGWANRDLNVGVIVSLAPNLKPFTDLLGVDEATVKKVLTSWGPGRYDAWLDKDGKAFRPDGSRRAADSARVRPRRGEPAHWTGFGLGDVLERLRRRDPDARLGIFFDARLNNRDQYPVSAKSGSFNTRGTPDLVTSKLRRCTSTSSPSRRGRRLRAVSTRRQRSTRRPTSPRGGCGLFTLIAESTSADVDRTVVVNHLVDAQAPVGAIGEIPFDGLPGRQAEQRRPRSAREPKRSKRSRRPLRIDQVQVLMHASGLVGVERPGCSS